MMVNRETQGGNKAQGQISYSSVRIKIWSHMQQENNSFDVDYETISSQHNAISMA